MAVAFDLKYLIDVQISLISQQALEIIDLPPECKILPWKLMPEYPADQRKSCGFRGDWAVNCPGTP